MGPSGDLSSWAPEGNAGVPPSRDVSELSNPNPQRTANAHLNVAHLSAMHACAQRYSWSMMGGWWLVDTAMEAKWWRL